MKIYITIITLILLSSLATAMTLQTSTDYPNTRSNMSYYAPVDISSTRLTHSGTCTNLVGGTCEANYCATENVTTLHPLCLAYLKSYTIAEGDYEDFAVAVRFGETAEGWDSSGESKNKTLTSPNPNADHYLIVRNTELDATLWLRVNDNYVGEISANVAGSGAYKNYAFLVNSTFMSASNTITIQSLPANSETTYIDYIGLISTMESGDKVVNNESMVGIYMDLNPVSIISDERYIYYLNNVSAGTSDHLSDSTLTDGYGSKIAIFPSDKLDGIYKILYEHKSLGYTTYYNTTNSTTFKIDSNAPVIVSLEPNTDFLVGTQYQVISNITDDNLDDVQIKATDGSIVYQNMTFNGTYWIANITFTSSFDHTLQVLANDFSGTQSIQNYLADTSNATFEQLETQNNQSFNLTSYIEVTSGGANYDLDFRNPIQITGEGTAQIDDFIINYTIPELDPKNIQLVLNDGFTANFSNDTTNFIYTTDAWDNDVQGTPYIFNNYLKFQLNDILYLQYKNFETANIRLYYSNLTNKNSSVKNISLYLPFRTSYSGGSKSIDVFKCVSGINWSAPSCDSYQEITSLFYDQNDETYHFGILESDFPTLDTDNDTLKDAMVIKIPEIEVDGELMLKVDLDNFNSEPSWATVTPTPPTGGGGGGGSPAEVSCAIQIIPQDIVLRPNSGIEKITIENNGDVSYTPSIEFDDEVGDLSDFIEITNIPGTVLPGKQVDFGIKFIDPNNFQEGITYLVLQSGSCIEERIKITSRENIFSMTAFQELFSSGKTFKEILLEPIAKKESSLYISAPFINIGLSWVLLLILAIIVGFGSLAKNLEKGELLNVILYIVIVVVTTFVVTILIAVAIKSLPIWANIILSILVIFIGSIYFISKRDGG